VNHPSKLLHVENKQNICYSSKLKSRLYYKKIDLDNKKFDNLYTVKPVYNSLGYNEFLL
jgi:hypothetical protein